MATTQSYYKIKNGLELPSLETLQVTDNTGPTVKPSLMLDFAKTKTLDPRITFTRASTATYYDGKTTVKAEENLLLWSQAFDTAPWSGSGYTITANATTAPDGTTTAESFVPDTTAVANHQLSQNITVAANTTYTVSIYAKAFGYTKFAFRESVATGAYAIFDLASSGSVISTGNIAAITILGATITSVGSGWFRATVTFTSSVASAYGMGFFSLNNTYTSGDPYNVGVATGNGTDGIYIWGAQVEQLSRATAYTPTTTAAITNYIPVLQTAATNTARFDHDPITGESKGLLIEEQRTNLFTSSDNINAIAWTQVLEVDIQQNAITAPNGTQTAFKVIPNTVNYPHGFGQYFTPTVNTHTVSIYAKKGEIDTFNTFAWYGGSWGSFNLTTGVTSTSGGTAKATMIPVGNGWYRCIFTWDAIVQDGIRFSIGNLYANTNWVGDGKSGLYFWGPQAELGSFATSFTPTPLTYTGRGSTGTYLASDGLIRTAPANTLRYNANESGGSNLLLENAATNHITSTDNVNDWSTALGAVSITYEAVGQDGNYAYKFSKNAPSSGQSHVNFPVGSQGTTFTFSIYVKVGNQANVWLQTTSSNVQNNAYHYFNLSTLTSSTTDFGPGTATVFTRNISAIGNGLYRISVTCVGFTTSDILGNQIRLGLGTSQQYASTTDYCYFWGPQVESSTSVTSIIPSVYTFTGRSSVATYYDSTGILRTAASGQPRYSYNPSLLTAPPKLLLEPQSSNLILLSVMGNIGTNWQQYNTAVLTPNYTTAPDGTTTAGRIVTTSGSNGTVRVGTTSLVTSTIYAASIWIKSNTSSNYNLYLQVGDTDVVQCTVTPTWQRFSGFGAPQQNGYNFIDLEQIQGGADISVWGAQLETGYGASSYIATGGSSVTRAADTSTSVAQTRAADIYSSAAVTRSVDSASMTGVNFSTWYNYYEGTMYAEASKLGLGGSNIFVVSDNTLANRTYLATSQATSTPHLRTFVSSTDSGLVGSSYSAVPYQYFKIAGAYEINDAASSTNGLTVATDSTYGVITNPSRAYLGIGADGADSPMNGHIKKIAYYQKRMSNAELVNLTST